jgi:hypothetical protein
MQLKRPTPEWPVAFAILILMASAFSAHWPVRATAMSIAVQPSESQPVRLALECVDSTTIRFEITNVGSTDTAVRVGSVLGNGQKYLIAGLNLRTKPSNGNATDYPYWPSHYPSAIGGRLDQWFQALPPRAAYRMSAKSEDFFALGRQPSFSPGIELSLRWTISAETPKSLVPLVYWTGTLISNSCTAP